MAARVWPYWELFIGFSGLVSAAWFMIEYLLKEMEECKGIDGKCGNKFEELQFTCSLGNIEARNILRHFRNELHVY
jgi:hypothetical protein